MKRQKFGSIETKVSRFLFSYRTSPQSTTGIPPAEMLMKRHLKTRLDLIKPDIGKRVEQEQYRQKRNRDKKELRDFEITDSVWVENTTTGDTWLKGTIVDKTGPLSYLVKLTSNGLVVRKHVDQLRARVQNAVQSGDINIPSTQVEITPESIISEPRQYASGEQAEGQSEESTVEPPKEPDLITEEKESPTVEKLPTRPTRTISRPTKFKDFITDFK